MSVETATLLSVASIGVAAVLNIIGIIIVSRVTLKASREQSAEQAKMARDSWVAQAEIARESWKAQHTIVMTDSRARWIMERFEKIAAVLDNYEMMITRAPEFKMDERTKQLRHEARIAYMGLAIESSARKVLESYQLLRSTVEQWEIFASSESDAQALKNLGDTVRIRIQGLRTIMREQVNEILGSSVAISTPPYAQRQE